jgi:hypothetical protein
MSSLAVITSFADSSPIQARTSDLKPTPSYQPITLKEGLDSLILSTEWIESTREVFRVFFLALVEMISIAYKLGMSPGGWPLAGYFSWFIFLFLSN